MEETSFFGIVRKYGNSLMLPITKVAKEIDLKENDGVYVRMNKEPLKEETYSFDDYVISVLGESKKFDRAKGILFLTVNDNFWQTKDIIRNFVEKEIKHSKKKLRGFRLSEPDCDYDVYFNFDEEKPKMEVVIDHDRMKTIFGNEIDWMWIETVGNESYFIVLTNGFDYDRTIVFVTHCQKEMISKDDLDALMESGIYVDRRKSVINYLRKIKDSPEINESCNIRFFLDCFDLEKDVMGISGHN